MRHVYGGVGAALLIVLAVSARAGDFAACAALFPGGAVPPAKSSTVVDLCKSADGQAIFAVRFDTARKIPTWTAHSLGPTQKTKIDNDPAYPSRRDFFAPDPEVADADQAHIKAYRNTGYNKGHLVRAQDMNWNAAAYRASYVMTNMTPQRGALNSGPWLGMENAFHDLVAKKQMTLWAIAGAYGVNATMPTLENHPGNTTVPKCFYKIVVGEIDADDGGKTYKTLSALFVNDDHDRKQTTWTTHVTTLDTIKARTGIDFLRGLNVESAHDAAFWGVVLPDPPADCP